jgi:hypothetical protein
MTQMPTGSATGKILEPGNCLFVVAKDDRRSGPRTAKLTQKLAEKECLVDGERSARYSASVDDSVTRARTFDAQETAPPAMQHAQPAVDCELVTQLPLRE